MTVDTAAVAAPDGVSPFADNAEFLDAKLAEFACLIEVAVARREVQGPAQRAPVMARPPSLAELLAKGGSRKRRRLWRQIGARQPMPAEDLAGDDPDGDDPDGADAPLPVGDDALSGDDAGDQGRLSASVLRLHQAERAHQAARALNDARLTASTAVRLPFVDMAASCQLDRFEQDVVWLLFFKTVSPDFRLQYDAAELGQFGNELLPEIYIGNLLQLLLPGQLSRQLAACRHFSLDAPLLAHHLVRQARQVQNSILEVELELPHRVVAWISDDHRSYSIDCPFVVERPQDRLEQVVLRPELMQQALQLVEQFDSSRQQRELLGLGDTLTFGRCVTMLEYGPPGTGKTLLARALANHTGRPLVLLNRQGNNTHMEPEEVISTLFREARLQHGIVFIDECEEVCSQESDWLRPLLTELERTEALVIMATNRPTALAPALDRRCTIKLAFTQPNAAARERIWQVHLAGVPWAAEVDLTRLSLAYPLTGGYIRNAALTAINAALVRPAAQRRLTQADLEAAAHHQMHQVAGGVRDRELVMPRLKVADALLATAEREALSQLAAMAPHSLTQAAADDGPPWVAQPHRGLKVLVTGPSYSTGLQAAEALAGELGVLMTRVPLAALLDSSADRQESETGSVKPGHAELFAGLGGADHVLVVTDDDGQLSLLKEAAADGALRALFGSLGAYGGVALVVTAAARVALPRWARVFDEELRLAPPDTRTQQQAWVRLSGALLTPAQAEYLASRHDLTIEEIQMALHRARMRGATSSAAGVEAPAPMLPLVEEAAAALCQRHRSGNLLFG
jgi:MoxR-like ATPase